MANNNQQNIRVIFNPRAEKLINLQEWRNRYENNIDKTLTPLEHIKRAVFHDPAHLISGLKDAFDIARKKKDAPTYYVSRQAANIYARDGLLPAPKDIYVMQETVLDASNDSSFKGKQFQKFTGTQGKLNRARLRAVNDCQDFSPALKSGRIVPLRR